MVLAKLRILLAGASVSILLLVLGYTDAAAMNDTNAVVAEGLFPLQRDTPLVLLSEKVTVTLHPGTLKVSRCYVVKNPTPSPLTPRFGTTCLPTWSRRDFNAEATFRAAHENTSVLADGESLTVTYATDRLVDNGTHVVVEERTLEEIQECNRENDGDICGEAWLSFCVAFEPDQTRTLEVDYSTQAFEPRFIEYVLDRLNLYTEKFWSGNSIPHIEINFRVEGIALEEGALQPRGAYTSQTRAPDEYGSGTFTWIIADYIASRESLTYTTRMVHPDAVDCDAIEDAFRAIAAPNSTGPSEN